MASFGSNSHQMSKKRKELWSIYTPRRSATWERTSSEGDDTYTTRQCPVPGQTGELFRIATEVNVPTEIISVCRIPAKVSDFWICLVTSAPLKLERIVCSTWEWEFYGNNSEVSFISRCMFRKLDRVRKNDLKAYFKWKRMFNEYVETYTVVPYELHQILITIKVYILRNWFELDIIS